MAEEHATGTTGRSGGGRRWLKVTLITLGVVVGVAVLFVLTSVATDASTFCDACHEMVPFVDAWSEGEHAGEAECVECHVDDGFVARLEHKPRVSKEIWAHVTGDTSFPRPEPAEVPDRRCVRCHERIDASVFEAFSHDEHEKAADTCQACHDQTGHDVSRKDLEAAGILDEANFKARTPAPPSGEVVAVPNGGVANVKGHPKNGCDRCHDMRKTGCAACHEQPKRRPHVESEKRCELCHVGNARWTFRHPDTDDCEKCHAPEPGHFTKDCDKCHDAAVPFSKATFKHPRVPGNEEHSFRSFPCISCHPRQVGTVGCTCHDEGVPRD